MSTVAHLDLARSKRGAPPSYSLDLVTNFAVGINDQTKSKTLSQRNNKIVQVERGEIKLPYKLHGDSK